MIWMVVVTAVVNLDPGLLVVGNVGKGNVAQDVTLAKDVRADGAVDDDGEENAHPDGEVVRVDPEGVPPRLDPAPELQSPTLGISQV